MTSERDLKALGMTKESRRQYLKDQNVYKCHCQECDGWDTAVVIDIRMEEDYGENKGKEYPMLVFKCLECKEVFEDWEDNDW